MSHDPSMRWGLALCVSALAACQGPEPVVGPEAPAATLPDPPSSPVEGWQLMISDAGEPPNELIHQRDLIQEVYARVVAGELHFRVLNAMPGNAYSYHSGWAIQIHVDADRNPHTGRPVCGLGAEGTLWVGLGELGGWPATYRAYAPGGAVEIGVSLERIGDASAIDVCAYGESMLSGTRDPAPDQGFVTYRFRIR